MSEAEAKLWQEYVGTRDRLVELKAQLAKTCFADAVKSPTKKKAASARKPSAGKVGKVGKGKGNGKKTVTK